MLVIYQTLVSIPHMLLTVVMASMVLTGCAMMPIQTQSPHIGKNGALGRCADFFASLDKRSTRSQVRDAGTFRVKGYPYLRINRFLASFRGEVKTTAAYKDWVNRMQALDQAARNHEIANLPAASGSESVLEERQKISTKVIACGDLLKSVDFQDTDQWNRLQQKAAAPDEYIFFRRVLGLYPITSALVSIGVAKWHQETRENFSTTPPQNWHGMRYFPDVDEMLPSVSHILRGAERDALGIPTYSREAQKVLFRQYAPVWEVQSRKEHDRIGTPAWENKGALDVDTSRPVTYTLISFTRFEQKILTQLNYNIWFPSRPEQNALDVYAGHLDGINLRITLDDDGVPLLYETMHNCGCYYKAYPTNRLKVREKITYAERPLVLQAPEADPSGKMLTIAMTSKAHYVQHMYLSNRKEPFQTVRYSLRKYGDLLSLSMPEKERRSMFNQYGTVSGTERMERFFLWPTGVLSPGAMRQWGRHAVAFVGKRHFDDPNYMEMVFSTINRDSIP